LSTEAVVPVLFEHRGAFGFGRVRGQHGFNAHLGKDFQDFLRGETGRLELGKLLPPKSGFVGKAVFNFAQMPRPCRRVLLDHVQELESY
jgi:hypothetical protein